MLSNCKTTRQEYIIVVSISLLLIIHIERKDIPQPFNMNILIKTEKRLQRGTKKGQYELPPLGSSLNIWIGSCRDQIIKLTPNWHSRNILFLLKSLYSRFRLTENFQLSILLYFHQNRYRNHPLGPKLIVDHKRYFSL